MLLTLQSPSYFEVSQAQGGGGGGRKGTLCPSPPEFLYNLADYHEIWHRCKTSHDLKDSTIKISQGHHVGAHFHKMWPKIRKYMYDRKIWHTCTLKESHVWGSNSNITSVNDLNMWYFISLMIKENIPYLEWTYLLQLMVQTLNETAINLPLVNPYSTRDGAKHVI